MLSFSELTKGLLIGTANILPGVSGSSMAISMGVYDRILLAVSHLPKTPKESLSVLLPYLLGAGIGVIGLSFSLEYLFDAFPLQTMLIFTGLILGGVPSLYFQLEKQRPSRPCLLILLCAFFSTLLLASLRPQQAQAVSLAPSPIMTVLLFLLGVLAAPTLIVPGLSGSMILMMLGLYQPLLYALNGIFKHAACLDFQSMVKDGLIFMPFCLGILLGIFLFSRLMEWVFAHYREPVSWGLLGLVLASPFALLSGMAGQTITNSTLAFGILLFAASLLASTCFSLKELTSA